MKMPSVLDFGWTPESETGGIFFGQLLVKKKAKAEKSLQRNNFSALYLENGHSHSMVPMGLGVRSIRTRLMPSTSWVMR